MSDTHSHCCMHLPDITPIVCAHQAALSGREVTRTVVVLHTKPGKTSLVNFVVPKSEDDDSTGAGSGLEASMATEDGGDSGESKTGKMARRQRRRERRRQRRQEQQE